MRVPIGLGEVIDHAGVRLTASSNLGVGPVDRARLDHVAHAAPDKIPDALGDHGIDVATVERLLVRDTCVGTIRIHTIHTVLTYTEYFLKIQT